ncbi:stage IV sporulation protein FB [Ornithinibacillus sp. L9]|uniref:Stage IV sporulation protein FB n=2 Tax=Ornithinibacillus caprae TaxID=2678566 RepID=A0A6N8FGX1_9BACI|nr:stage IV sporulation protein FB [Ornithinibacillus caprae]
MIILSIVFIHELGHYVVAKLFKWRIRSIVLWVFGGTMDTDEHGNRPIHEEALVTIAGPFQHIIIYLIVSLLPVYQVVPPSLIELILFYNTVILFFNLLPIWPLDGGKLLFLLLSSYFPYKKSYHVIIVFSMIVSVVLLIGQLVFYPFTLSTFLIMIFLFMENRSEWKQRYYVFMRFLLQRYEGNFNHKGVRSIVVPHQLSLMEVFALFQRDKKHTIYIKLPSKQRVAVDENDCLYRYFYEKQYAKTIGDVAMEIL